MEFDYLNLLSELCRHHLFHMRINILLQGSSLQAPTFKQTPSKIGLLEFGNKWRVIRSKYTINLFSKEYDDIFDQMQCNPGFEFVNNKHYLWGLKEWFSIWAGDANFLFMTNFLLKCIKQNCVSPAMVNWFNCILQMRSVQYLYGIQDWYHLLPQPISIERPDSWDDYCALNG